MFTVVKMGGCNGSGKTSVAREIIKLADAKPKTWKGAAKSPNYYEGVYEGFPVLILGSYETNCGGMDTISDKFQRLAFIQWAAKANRIVFFEGLMTGKTYGAIGTVSEAHVAGKRGTWLYAFLDTPFEVCAERVVQRRTAAGNLNPFDPERTMRSTFNSVTHLFEKIEQTRAVIIGDPIYPHPTIMLDHKLRPVALARRVLNRAAMIQRKGL